MLCDREKTDIPSCQIFFINNFTLDLTRSLKIAYPQFYVYINNMENNKKLWEEKKGKPYMIKDENKQNNSIHN